MQDPLTSTSLDDSRISLPSATNNSNDFSGRPSKDNECQRFQNMREGREHLLKVR